MTRKSTTALIASLAFVTICPLIPAAAWSQAPRPAAVPYSDVQLAEGRRHFAQGVALYEEGNYQAALSEFQAAYATAPAASILYNIGLTNKALYRYVEAIEVLERYLDEAARDPSKDAQPRPERRREVLKLIEGMKALLAPVTFNLSPPGAQLLIDGRAVTLPENRTMPLAAGNHVATVSAPQHESATRDFVVAAAHSMVIAIDLKAIPQTGKVRITSSQPGTTIEIDGQARGLAPLELELGPGGHQLLARGEGFEPYRAELMLVAGQQRNVDIELVRPPPPVEPDRPLYKRWWFWTAIGTAVAGGTVTALLLRPGVQAPLSGGLQPGSIPVDQGGLR